MLCAPLHAVEKGIFRYIICKDVLEIFFRRSNKQADLIGLHSYFRYSCALPPTICNKICEGKNRTPLDYCVSRTLRENRYSSDKIRTYVVPQLKSFLCELEKHDSTKQDFVAVLSFIQERNEEVERLKKDMLCTLIQRVERRG